MDIVAYIVTSVILGGLGLLLLYFVIKAAVRNAFIEDRAFQAKVQKLRADNAAVRAAQPAHLDTEGA